MTSGQWSVVRLKAVDAGVEFKARMQNLSTAESIERMVGILVEGWSPSLIILFGSRARGDEKGHSDVDLLIVLPDDAYRKDVAVEMRHALSAIPVAKDLIVVRESTLRSQGELIGTVYREALREGQILHAAA